MDYETSGADLEARGRMAAKKNEGRVYVSDADYVYHNLTNPEADQDSAPSNGAWGLLQWAQENRKEFYGKYGPKLTTGESEESDEVKKEKKTVGERIDLFESFMRDYQKKKRQRLLEIGETEHVHQTYKNGKPPLRSIHTITSSRGT